MFEWDIWVQIVALPLLMVGIGVFVYWLNRISDPDEEVR
jgi:hypothetical protein